MIFTPKSNCTICDSPLDAATGALHTGARPEAGDVSVCLYCGNVAVFDEALSLRSPTTEEKSIFDRDEQLAKVRNAVNDRVRVARH